MDVLQDPFESQIEGLWTGLRAGVASFTIGPSMLADLLDQADSRADIVKHRLAFGVVAVLDFLKNQEAQIAFLEGTLGAVQREEGHYELDTGSYVALFYLKGDRWTWGTKDQPAWRSKAMEALEENHRRRSSHS
jgi:hypothetical protein